MPRGAADVAGDPRIDVNGSVDTSKRQHEKDRSSDLKLLLDVGLALTTERQRDKVVDDIVSAAQNIGEAAGATLYLRNENVLQFCVTQNKVLGIHENVLADGISAFNDIPLFDEDGATLDGHIATETFHKNQIMFLDDMSSESRHFSGPKEFEARTGFVTNAMWSIPVPSPSGAVLGVLQIINPSFHNTPNEKQQVISTLASFAGVTLENIGLLEDNKRLLESFISLIAHSIDAKSPYTGKHCERVPVIAEALCKTICESESPEFDTFSLDKDEWYELRIAAALHDCGKLVTPVHVLDKATKLEGIRDSMDEIEWRFEAAKASMMREGGTKEECALLDRECQVIRTANLGGEYLAEEKKDEIRRIGSKRFTRVDGRTFQLIDKAEIENLCISKGTLNEDERTIVNGHMVHTIQMLEALPLPKSLERIPEYAGGHHEKMDGTGYPKGKFAGDMSIPARALAVADVFEALISADRPYKAAKRLSETMRIIGYMKQDNHLDPEIVDLFVRSGLYRELAQRFVAEELRDEVDEDWILSIKPKPFHLPAERTATAEFLPRYASILSSGAEASTDEVNK